MNDRIIEILNKYVVDLYLHGLRYGWETNTPLFDEIASALSVVSNERLREELIKFVNVNFTDIIGDGTIFVDEYLKTIEK